MQVFCYNSVRRTFKRKVGRMAALDKDGYRIVGPNKKVRVFYSANYTNRSRSSLLKWHLDPVCSGLQYTPLEDRASSVLEGAKELCGDFGVARPCRICTLEPALKTLLKVRRGDRKTVTLATFSSQPAPDSRDVNLATYKWNSATESGTARIERVASHLGLETAFNPLCGRTVYGFVPSHAVSLLAGNLRTWVMPEETELPNKGAIECLWTLLNDAKSLHTRPGETALWEIAKKLA